MGLTPNTSATSLTGIGVPGGTAAVEDHPAKFVDDGALRVVGLAAREFGEQRGVSTAGH